MNGFPSKQEKRPGGSVVEHVLGKDEVTGSNPVLGSIYIQVVSLG